MENLICVWRMLRKQKNKTKQSKIKQKQKTKNSVYYEIPKEREKKKNTVELRICHLVIYLSIYFLLKYGFHYYLQNFDEIIMLKYG